MYSPLRTLLRAWVLVLTLIIGTSTINAIEKDVDKDIVTIVAEVPEPTLQAHHGKLLINIPGSDNVTISVLALTGKLVKQVTVTPGHTQLDLPAGFYIIRIGQTVKRIAMT